MGAIAAPGVPRFEQGLTFNVKTYGAKGDGTTDDTTAFQTAITAWRASMDSFSQLVFDKQNVLLIPPGRYKITGSLNLQKLYFHSWAIYAEGATILANCTGKTVFDCLGSRFGSIYGLTILGDATNRPAIGIQTGRLAASPAAYGYSDSFLFENVRMGGYFSRSCYYGLQSEIDTWVQCELYNSYSAGEGAAWIHDGYNWTTYGAITDFQAPAQATNTVASCSMHTWIGCTGSVANGPAFVFIEAQIVETVNTYQVTLTGEACRVWTLGSIFGFKWDVHTEGTAVTDTVTFNRIASGAISIYDLTIKDTLSQASNSILKQGTNATALFIYNAVVETGSKFQGNAQPFKGDVGGANIVFNGILNGQAISCFYTGDLNVDLGLLTAPASVNNVPSTGILTAPRTWTLPLLSKYPLGIKRVITDLAGGVSNGNYLKIVPAGSDTINGKTSWIMRSACRSVEFQSLLSSGRWTAPAERDILRLGTQADRTTNTTLSNIVGMVFTLAAGKTYRFRAVLFVTADGTGGSKVAMGGTVTATSIRYAITCINLTATPPVFLYGGQQTAVAGSSGGAGGTSHEIVMEGTIVVNAEGTFAPQFAENASSGTSSVLVGSQYEIEEIPT